MDVSKGIGFEIIVRAFIISSVGIAWSIFQTQAIATKKGYNVWNKIGRWKNWLASANTV
jgi:hypothetical protein